MAKREFAHPNEMPKYVGQEIGVSDWVEVSQDRINQFADATGDHQWIHVDVERAKKDMPGGKTIAHGFLTLSLIPMLNSQISHINNVRNGINYGCNKVRFTSPVPAGSRVRARAKLQARPMRASLGPLTDCGRASRRDVPAVHLADCGVRPLEQPPPKCPSHCARVTGDAPAAAAMSQRARARLGRPGGNHLADAIAQLTRSTCPRAS